MRSSAALLVGVLLVVSIISGVGAGHPGDGSAHPARALSTPAMGTPAVATPDASSASATPSASDALATSDASTALSHAPRDTTVASSPTNESANVTVRDGTQLYVTLHENGNARWSVTAQFALHDENETAAFRDLVTQYESGNADAGGSRETFERIVERAGTGTEREMAMRNVTRTGGVRQNGSVGHLSFSFTWTNFTHVEEGRIVLGDAFWVEDETWLPSLTDDQTLTIEGPPGYYVASSNVAHNGLRVRYEGPRSFSSGDFSISYAPKQTETPATTDPGGFDFSGTNGLIIVLFLFGLGGFGAYAAAQRRGPDPDPVEETESVRRAATEPASAGDDSERRAADDAESDDEDEPPTELLSDEERVLRLLRENDGRMKQANIVKETNWSNAKVSQLLSKMNDDGAVNKLRIGRENLITLPDEDVTDVD